MPTIRELTSGEVRETEQGSEPFFSPPRGGDERRIDLRFKRGERISLPYGKLIDVIYNPASPNTAGLEILGLYYTGYWAVTFTGQQLFPLYEALQSHGIYWAREALENEVPMEGMPFIVSINVTRLTDTQSTSNGPLPRQDAGAEESEPIQN